MKGGADAGTVVPVLRFASQPWQQRPYGNRVARERSQSEHRSILDHIAKGDPRAAETVAREHLSRRGPHARIGTNLVVRANLLRDWQ